MNRQFFIIIIISIFMGMMLNASPALAEAPIQLSISPDTIAIDALYDGESLSITGTLPSDCEAVIRMTGESKDVKMKRKEKLFGLLWMNRTTFTFESAPNAFFLCVPEKFEGTPESGEKDSPIRNIGLSSLENKITIQPETEDRDVLVKEFLKLKRKEGLYAVKGGMDYKMSGGIKNYTTTLRTPSKLSPGKYTVEAFAIRNGEIISRAEHPIEARLEGLPALLSKLAFHYSAVYGVLATLVALITGLITGLIFGGGKGAH